MKTAIVILLISVALVACGFGSGGNMPGVTSDPEKAAIAIYPENPTSEESKAMLKDGEQFYAAFGCASCHSTSSDRAGLVGPPLSGVGERYLARNDNDELLAKRWLVKHIKVPAEYPGIYFQTEEYGNFMPPNKNISDADMKALVEFLWALK